MLNVPVGLPEGVATLFREGREDTSRSRNGRLGRNPKSRSVSGHGDVCGKNIAATLPTVVYGLWPAFFADW